MGLLCCIAIAKSFGQTCITCPADAQAAALGVSLGIFAIQNGETNIVTGQQVGACDQLMVVADLIYNPKAQNAQGQIVTSAGFTGGTGHIILPEGIAVDVTPDDMATTLVGPAPCGTTAVKPMKALVYTLTPADIAQGSVAFTFQYTNATFLLTNQAGQCVLKETATLIEGVVIAPPLSCAVSPATKVVGTGSSASFTVTESGLGPFTFLWSGPGGFSSTDASITINDAEPGTAGLYTATVTDAFGCSASSTGTLIVGPQCPKCPPEAEATSIGASGPSTFAIQDGQTNNVSGGTVSPCNRLILQAVVAYGPFGLSPNGQIVVGAGFIGGMGYVVLPDGSAVDITPDDMATTIVGPASCGTPSKSMKTLNYTLTAEDVAAGSALFTFVYTNATFLLPNNYGICDGKFSFSLQQSVSIDSAPVCSVVPSVLAVRAGDSATFAFAGSLAEGGPLPVAYCWQKGCPGAGPCVSTDPSLIITNAQPADGGCYTLMVTDSFGCSTNCQAVLKLRPNFTNLVTSGSQLVFGGSGGSANGSYIVLTATNISSGATDWAPIITNSFGPDGGFIITNIVDPTDSKRYFRLSVQ